METALDWPVMAGTSDQARRRAALVERLKTKLRTLDRDDLRAEQLRCRIGRLFLTGIDLDNISDCLRLLSRHGFLVGQRTRQILLKQIVALASAVPECEVAFRQALACGESQIAEAAILRTLDFTHSLPEECDWLEWLSDEGLMPNSLAGQAAREKLYQIKASRPVEALFPARLSA